jgi:hypothetical protein
MRRPDWPSRMFAVIDEHAGKPFVWGDRDCCLFPARVRDAMCDTSYELALRVAYSDEASALALIASHGGLFNAVTAFLGAPSTERATRGDIVGFDGGEGDAMGVCIGREIVAMGPDGLRRVPRGEILAVWK